MGYDLHIFRRSDWAEREGHDITLDEWFSYIELDKEAGIYKWLCNAPGGMRLEN